MLSFWGFGFSSEEDSTNFEVSPEVDGPAKQGYETPPALGSLPQKGRSWASSVLESFRVDTRLDSRTKSPGEEDLESSSLEAFRSFTRRAHQLLARQHHRALVSRRGAAHENSYATERLSLALAEADELEEVLKQHSQHSKGAGAGEDHTSPSDLCDTERLTISGMSGWSTSASSSTKPTELLCRWESEDADARQELETLRTCMSQTAGELRSGLLRLAFSSPDPGDEDGAGGNSSLCQVLSAALPQLVQSCADAMEVGSSEDDWAAAEASLFEALAQVTSAACDSPADLDFQLQEDAFAGHHFTASAEEQRDHTALHKLLGKLDALSRQLELEAGENTSTKQTGHLGHTAAASARLATSNRLAELEAQVQRMVAENQALEEQLHQLPSRDAMAAMDAQEEPEREPLQPVQPQERVFKEQKPQIERMGSRRDTGRVHVRARPFWDIPYKHPCNTLQDIRHASTTAPQLLCDAVRICASALQAEGCRQQLLGLRAL